MRSFLAFAIVLCVLGGLYLLTGPEFFVPDRWDPSRGVLLVGLSSRLLGAGLLAAAWAGVTVTRQAGKGEGKAPSQRWQWRFFLLQVLALGLMSAAMFAGERGPNPEWRPKDSAMHGRADPAGSPAGRAGIMAARAR